MIDDEKIMKREEILWRALTCYARVSRSSSYCREPFWHPSAVWLGERHIFYMFYWCHLARVRQVSHGESEPVVWLYFHVFSRASYIYITSWSIQLIPNGLHGMMLSLQIDGPDAAGQGTSRRWWWGAAHCPGCLEAPLICHVHSLYWTEPLFIGFCNWYWQNGQHIWK